MVRPFDRVVRSDRRTAIDDLVFFPDFFCACVGDRRLLRTVLPFNRTIRLKGGIAFDTEGLFSGLVAAVEASFARERRRPEMIEDGPSVH